MTAEDLKTLARFPLITLEKTSNSSVFHWPHGLPLTCQNGTNLSACGCCEEDQMIATGRRIKKINAKAQVCHGGYNCSSLGMLGRVTISEKVYKR